MTNDQIAYGNEWERTVIGHEPIDPDVYAREIGRYKWAAERIKSGDRVLEFGCSSGFGTRLLPEDVDYTGVDYSKQIVAYATEHFATDQRRFVWSTIDSYLDKAEAEGLKFDVVIAFEVLEHVKNGREVAQRLKKFAPTVLLSTPYREPVGFWGKHHVLHGLREKDFPQFGHSFMHIDGTIHSFPTCEVANLLMMEWHSGTIYADRSKVLAAVPTKNRPEALMQCLQAIAFQTVPPDKIIIYDDHVKADGSREDFREHPIGRYIFPLLTQKGVEWEVVFTPGKGQHIAHQMSNESGYEFVWRLDDDCVAEPDVLERLLMLMKPDVGAAAGAVYEMNRLLRGGKSKLAEFFTSPNVQWAPDQGYHDDVDYLYCSFLYRAGLVDYKHEMSPAAFHEETIFSHRLKRAGWKLIVDTSIHTHHFKAPTGGTRDASRGPDQEWAYAWDHAEFMRIMEDEWGTKLVHLGVGIGDNFAFLNILPELKACYERVIIGSCHPEIFKDSDVTLIPYDVARQSAKENVYNWMAEHNWKGSIVDAYREMYLGKVAA